MNSNKRYKLLAASIMFGAAAIIICGTPALLSRKVISKSSAGLTKATQIYSQGVGIDNGYTIDLADDKILVGASHYIFIGRVIGQIGTQDVGIGPETQFSVEVISDIKGGLMGTVIVDEQGGYDSNGQFYYIEGGAPLLQPGSTYLLATRYNSTENWYTLNSFPTASKLISTDSDLGTSQLQYLAVKDSRVQQLQAAYPKEILLTADIAHNNTLNSYQSLHPTQQNVGNLIGATSTVTISTSSISPSGGSL